MRFAVWQYVYLLGLVPCLLLLYAYAFARKRQALAFLLDAALLAHLVPGLSHFRQWCKALCLVSATGCLVLALMQPQWGKRWQDLPRRGRDLMIVLDVSRSMLAEDVIPNRLERAKLDIKDLLQVIQQEGGHRLGLIAFAGRASLQCPLTLDYAFFLEQLHQVGPETIGRGGTLIGDAIRLAVQHLGTLSHHAKDIILITDGDDQESFPAEAARAAAEQHINIYTIGIGDAAMGARIPQHTRSGQPAYVQHEGKEVYSRMQESLLLEIARLTGGAYVPAGIRPIELDRIYTSTIAPKAYRDLEPTAREYLAARYPWFIGAGLLFLITEMLLQERAQRREKA